MDIASPCSIDVETTGVKREDTADPRRAKFVCAAVAPHGIVTFSIPKVLPGANVCVHNMPYDAVVLGAWDVNWDDTKILAHIGGHPDTTLKGLQTRLLGRPALHHDEAEERGQVPEYNLYDAINTWDLRPVLYDGLKPETRALYDTLERPLLPLWAKMTMEGSFNLDTPALQAYRTALAEDTEGALSKAEALLPRGRIVSHCTKCDLLRERMEKGQKCGDGENHSWAVPEFDPDLALNLNSPDQLLAAFTDMGLGVRDTGVDTLRLIAHRHPGVRALLDYRTLFKELSTYVEPFLRIAESGRRLGAVWRPTGTWAGGRVASAYPNLMNVPVDLERFFLAPEDGYELLTCDNSTLEVRIAAHVSQDPVLLEACRGGDFHSVMQETLGLPNRAATKVAVFGTLYLGGPAVILEQAQKYNVPMTWAEAQRLHDHVHATLPVYFRWAYQVSEELQGMGLFGLTINVPLGEEKHMQRAAVNARIQPPAGLVTKYQMLALWRVGYWVVRQVHDSVTVAVPRAALADARVEVPRIMEGAAPELDVPIKVEVK
ncbi:hypothetical protein LCGC14_1990300 [marine sediment metagenome]|uniref:DNA-directed DNA polymerase family A palm domain-containing protein n=1 Tax=marine sediment metagenome TaxID=412755 RepID=A0A0F9F6J1_9ZZZZ